MNRLRNRHLLLIDLLLIPLAVYASFLLRLEMADLASYGPGCILMSSGVTIATPLLLMRARLYQQYWRYASSYDLMVLIRNVTIAVTGISALVLQAGLWMPTLAIPLSIPLIALPLVLGAVSAPRLLLRLRSARGPRPSSAGSRMPVLIMGAGDAGALIVRELQQNPHLNKAIVALLDDDDDKHGMSIYGVPVLGGRTAIPDLVSRHQVRQVVVAMPTAPGKEIRAILQICKQAGVETLTVPGLYDLLNGSLSVSQLRTIEISDLLRRTPVETDLAAVRQLIHGRRVMVTGGGGSIGSELCRQVLRCGPSELLILGHGENSVFEIQNELLRLTDAQPHASRITAIIADIRDTRRIHSLFKRHRPAIVFHAAAHKHVPLMEENPVEAVSNNVLGTRNLLDAAMATEVERFVMISTDKAVNPTSVMGTTKRAAEMLVHRAAQISGRPYVAVRFGNVLGSRGSVVLTFKRQIAAGGPVTVTDPEMRRYFMTIPEAVQLVLQAGALGRKGEVFMLDMGEPVRVVDLARDMIRLSGLEEGRDIDIVYSGLRPGEKLFEELFAKGESYRPTTHSKIFIADNASSCVPNSLMASVATLERQVEAGNDADLLKLLRTLVPEYQSPAHAPEPALIASQLGAPSLAAYGD
ncbi:MAG: polysaccharide biosynthesis protein [Chloroflexales bacterium]|nr:polysaccharide biosynthesis protein [Chloroflexales bacterium]